MDTLYPLTFEPNVHFALWGKESWEISGHPSAPSVVSSGTLAGRTLAELASSLGARLVGKRALVPTRFPLLFKVIEAHDSLSVQVHPGEEAAKRLGGEPKSEMWHILGGEGSICAGLVPGTTKDELAGLLKSGAIADRLVRHAVKHGDSYSIPAGLVHAIGANVRLYEVQQSSDTTYRLYDWGRVGDDGKPRALHLREAVVALDATLPPPTPSKDISTPYFNFRRIEVEGALDIAANPETFTAIYIVGEARSILVPANCAASIPCRGTVLVTTL